MNYSQNISNNIKFILKAQKIRFIVAGILLGICFILGLLKYILFEPDQPIPKFLLDFGIMAFPAFLGSALGFALADSIGKIDNFFDCDVIYHLVIERFNNSIQHLITENGLRKNKWPSGFEFGQVIEVDDYIDTRDDRTKKNSYVDHYKVLKSSASWKTNKVYIRGILPDEQGNNKVLHNEYDDNSKDKGEVSLFKCDKPIVIDMTFELLFKKPIPKEEHRNGYMSIMYTEIRLTGSVNNLNDNNNSNEFECEKVILRNNNTKNASSNQKNTVTILSEGITNCILNSFDVYKDYFNSKKNETKITCNTDKTGMEIVFYPNFMALPLKRLEEAFIDKYIYDLLEKIPIIFDQTFDKFPDSAFQKIEKYKSYHPSNVIKGNNFKKILEKEQIIKSETHNSNNSDSIRCHYCSLYYDDEEAEQVLQEWEEV